MQLMEVNPGGGNGSNANCFPLLSWGVRCIFGRWPSLFSAERRGGHSLTMFGQEGTVGMPAGSSGVLGSSLSRRQTLPL